MTAIPPMFDGMLDIWPDPLIIVDSSGLLVCLSPMAEQVLGWGTGECIGGAAHEKLCVQARGHAHTIEDCPFNAPQDYAQWQSVFWCTEDGGYLSVDVRATVLNREHAGYTAWSFVDNTALIHNRAEFEKFAQFVELSPAPMAEFDTEGQMLFANTAMQTLMVGAGFDAQGNSDALPKDLEALCRLCLTADNTNEADSKSDADSTVIALEGRFFKWHFVALNSAAVGVEPSIIGFAFDVTHQQRVREELEEAKRIARRDFYAKMIHELRTPLNAIMGFSDLLLARTQSKLSEREYRNLQSIKNAGFQLNELVTDTLDISKIEAGFMALEVSEFDLSALCHTFLPQIESLALAKKLAFESVLPDVAMLESDNQKVRQIIINLLSNAIKYTRQGHVTLTVRCSNESLVLSVADSGVGIPEAQKHKLFNQYSQIDEAQNAGISGTGLGLALVGELVKMLQGEIVVQSEYGKGSEFVVTLPLQYPR